MSIWILVSDASRATLYATEERGDDWRTIGSYRHPESRLRNSELTPTEPGHSAKSKGGSRRTAPGRIRLPNRLKWSISLSSWPAC